MSFQAKWNRNWLELCELLHGYSQDVNLSKLPSGLDLCEWKKWWFKLIWFTSKLSAYKLNLYCSMIVIDIYDKIRQSLRHQSIAYRYGGREWSDILGVHKIKTNFPKNKSLRHGFAPIISHAVTVTKFRCHTLQIVYQNLRSWFPVL